ncbi:hypothetical protein [Phenylobacterium sp.]|uniref:hypothetical protein n=1 Tax=Phenylobacterium sp. TaxID=1871053 RepID=UPI0011F7C40C|nr:hypothetical protein [Phenylobacterium sp.]THD61069.1 MAG: hypothetical protein E8A49_12450 [Phenylobacterium sp.]
MATIFEKLRVVFSCAERLNTAIWMDGRAPEYLSIAELADYVTNLTGVTITFKQVDAETDHIWGWLERYGPEGKQATIYIVKNIPERAKPAVAAKELCQLLLDEHEDWQPDGQDTLERLVTPQVELDTPDNLAVRSEVMAERLSYEILYPVELRRKHVEDIAQGAKAVPEIAAVVRLTVTTVEMLLADNYMRWATRWWEIILAEHDAKVASANAAE